VKRCFIFVVFLSLVFGHNPDTEFPNWKQYFRLGAVQTETSSPPGFASYVRLNRTTPSIFQDVRFYGHFFKDNQEIRVRQKTSRHFMSFDWLYSFNTLIYEKNTFIDVNLRYHFNQGFGWLIRNSEGGNMTAELGIAFDNSDYLNTNRKTSYARSGFTIDKKMGQFETKIEMDYFHQVSKQVDNTDLSRIKLVAETHWPIKKGCAFIIGFTEDFLKDESFKIENPSVFLTFSFKQALNWTF
tara:strand:+ start:3456 stop:4178 length:723 start_codon:yes stop_codon:yes gene_type:complete